MVDSEIFIGGISSKVIKDAFTEGDALTVNKIKRVIAAKEDLIKVFH